MRTRILSTLALGIVLLGTGSLHAGPRIAVGIGLGFGPPAPVYGYGPMPVVPPSAYVAAYPAPGYGYAWVPGSYYPYGGRYAWRAGFWACPPYRGARWVGPRYAGRAYYGGHWRR